jgi:hypothetical protein
MKILSIDIGIKNFAFCCIESEKTGQFRITQWEVLNLCGERPTCSYTIKNKKCSRICGKKASFSKAENNYCRTHAKKTEFVIPSKETKLSYFRKLKLNQLKTIAEGYNIPVSRTKKDTLQTLDDYIQAHLFTAIEETPAANVPLIDIGIAIAKMLEHKFCLESLDSVIIENQISPLANRMKAVQGMVAQYFIMNRFYNIEFVSAANKLKPYTTLKMSYNERKSFSTEITKRILHSDCQHNVWTPTFQSHAKKDDLADCLLQGLWYLHNKKCIQIPTHVTD